MPTEIYDYQGNRILELHSTGATPEVYVWDLSAINIWPDGEPDQAITLNFRQNVSTWDTTWRLTPSTADNSFRADHGIDEVVPQGGISNDQLLLAIDKDYVSGTGNTKYAYVGMLEDIWIHNVASLTWPSFVQNTKVNLTRVDTMNLYRYDFDLSGDPSNHQFRYFYNMFATGPDGFEPNEIGAGSLDFGAPDVVWYGERIPRATASTEITEVTTNYVYGDGDLYMDFDTDSVVGSTLRITPSGESNLIWRRLEDFGETPSTYLQRTGRLILTIERTDYDPGNEYIIGWYSDMNNLTDSYYFIKPTTSTSSAINYSDNPADQDSLTVVTGESVTYRIYEDII